MQISGTPTKIIEILKIYESIKIYGNLWTCRKVYVNACKCMVMTISENEKQIYENREKMNATK